MNKKEFILKDLDCANCAAKIEDNIKRLEGFSDVKLNFINKTLIIEKENKKIDKKEIENIKKIIKKIEPDVKVVEKEDIKNNERKDKFNKKAEIIRLILSIFFFVFAIIYNKNENIKIGLFVIAYLVSGYRVLLRSFKNILNGNVFDENFLMSIATIGAFAIREFPEAVGVMLFYEIGELLQSMAVDNSKRSIKKLLDIRPDFANLVRGDKVFKVNPEELEKGDIILVKPGERVPVDGIIIKGNSLIDSKALTGESKPANLRKGDKILSGMIVINGLLTVEVEKEYSQSTVARILDLVENASAKKGKTEKLITKFAKYYTPIVVILAFLILVIPTVLFNQPFNKWLYRALIFLVISCPCGLVVSIPLGYFAGIGALSKKGILVKGGNYIDIISKIDTIIFDKTGTLTEGVFQVEKIEVFNGFLEEIVVRFAAFAEEYSNHPIATSIKQYYLEKYHLKVFNNIINRNLIKDFKHLSGKGVKATIENHEIIVGNIKAIFENSKIKSDLFNKDKEKVENMLKSENKGKTFVYIVIDNIFAGIITISDKIKQNAKKMVNELKKEGIKNTVMLTGDNKEVAFAVKNYLGIDKCYAELLPEDKVHHFEKIKQEKKVAFVGDGINDAPVLAISDAGISMGGLGQDAAIEASDIVIMDDDLLKIPQLIKLSRKTLKIVYQNIFIVFAIKILFLSLGASGLTDMWGAVFADVGVTLIAIFNSLRIFKANKI